MNSLKEYGINYLIDSGFVNALVKKSIFSSDIDNLYEDYLQETFLSICELKDDIWQKLYDTAVENGTEYEYQIRNYISMLVRNVCHSSSSGAYKKLKRHNLTEYTKTDEQWRLYAYEIPDDTSITEQIHTMNEPKTVKGIRV